MAARNEFIIRGLPLCNAVKLDVTLPWWVVGILWAEANSEGHAGHITSFERGKSLLKETLDRGKTIAKYTTTSTLR